MVSSAPSAPDLEPWSVIRTPPDEPTGAEASALSIDGLTVDYEREGAWRTAVADATLAVDPGQAVGIAGESGSGKTTVALSVLGLLPENGRVDAGTISLHGQTLPIQSDEAMRRFRWRDIAIIFQGAMNSLNPVQRVRHQIAEPIMFHEGVSSRIADDRARELMGLVGIPADRHGAYPHELSGGMRQRSMIAMALSCRPSIVIGDEPTTALDVMLQAQILSLLARLRRELGLSILLISHDLAVLAQTCDRIVIMFGGRVLEQGPVAAIFETPRHPYTRALIAAIPNPDSGVRVLPPALPAAVETDVALEGCPYVARCPHAMAICSVTFPAPVTFTDGATVACHLYLGGSLPSGSVDGGHGQ